VSQLYKSGRKCSKSAASFLIQLCHFRHRSSLVERHKSDWRQSRTRATFHAPLWRVRCRGRLAKNCKFDQRCSRLAVSYHVLLCRFWLVGNRKVSGRNRTSCWIDRRERQNIVVTRIEAIRLIWEVVLQFQDDEVMVATRYLCHWKNTENTNSIDIRAVVVGITANEHYRDGTFCLSLHCNDNGWTLYFMMCRTR